MKLKIGIIILVAACIGLFIALLATKKSTEVQHTHDAAVMLDFSNQLDAASINLNDMRQVNLMLTNDLSTMHAVAETLSNKLAATTSKLATAKDSLAATKDSLVSAQGQIVNLNGRITDLESQNKALDERAADLTNRITALDALITDTQRKLASSETNNTFLAAELQKQMAQKAELERNFNDLNVVRAQVKKLRDELFITRRLQWMANGNDPSTPPKGAALLMQHPATSTSSVAKTPASKNAPAKTISPYDLNVEVGSDGSVHVISPPTNTPAR
jgi:predicted  nucleic acid-binding Zn-ribbon protein